MGQALTQASLGFSGVILKPHDQTGGHFGVGSQILFPTPNACTEVDGGS